MPDLPEITPDVGRVVARLQQQLGEALGQLVMLEDVIVQLQAERAKAAIPPPPDRDMPAPDRAKPRAD